jgi:hypothetical protein
VKVEEGALHDGAEGRDLIGDADPCNLDNVIVRDMNSSLLEEFHYGFRINTIHLNVLGGNVVKELQGLGF